VNFKQDHIVRELLAQFLVRRSISRCCAPSDVQRMNTTSRPLKPSFSAGRKFTITKFHNLFAQCLSFSDLSPSEFSVSILKSIVDSKTQFFASFHIHNVPQLTPRPEMKEESEVKHFRGSKRLTREAKRSGIRRFAHHHDRKFIGLHHGKNV
jgi:hypothetical protein